ncbi:hypothetical protein G7046_g4485 [Stylonectria norvegica]|nr:hypothetical protein G7046_g4485 [Stylonectria norvegica]
MNITQSTPSMGPGPLERIGMGFCGSVWSNCIQSEDAIQMVMKREDGGPGRSLQNEYQMLRRVLHALEEQRHNNATRMRFQAPSCYRYIENSEEETWCRILPQLSPGSTACNALLSEKIPPMPQSVREILVQEYFASDTGADEILRDRKNEHCLLRAYFGRRKHDTSTGRPLHRRPAFFSLRNFPLHVDQMENLGLPVNSYIDIMADALAFLHWSAKVDANDVEFVLARPRHGSATPSSTNAGTVLLCQSLGDHSLWILDFDCCAKMAMDEEGVDQAVQCFWRNDPYFPRPGAKDARDQQHWERFRDRFLQTSRLILNGECEAVENLPGLLMEKIVSTPSLEQVRDNLTIEIQHDAGATDDTPESCLKQMLSTKSVVSTWSCFAERLKTAMGKTAEIRESGTGVNGQIFEHPSTPFVYNLPTTDQPAKLWNKYTMHKWVQLSFEALPFLDG